MKTGTSGRIAAALVLAGLTTGAAAAEPRLKPFVLASQGPGELGAATDEVKARLAAAGFEVAGSYAPYDGAVVLAVTSAELKAAAAQQRFGAYAAAQRVSVTRLGDEVQVAYTSPVYMAAAYRLPADLSPVAAKLGGALGGGQEFGSKDGKTAKDLRGYHYMLGMPYFDEPVRLGKFATQAEAIAAVEAGLGAGRGGTTRVYRIDVSPEETVFGVGLSNGCAGDGHIMKEIDFQPLRSTGHLPYELVVSRGEVLALHAKFRIAVNFTDLKMMGSHSFMNIRCAPDAIEKSLRQAVGG